MLKGLEVSEVQLSDILNGNNFRIDSEYYEKRYLTLESKLDNYGTKTIFDICNQITDFGAFSQTNFIEFLENGVLFLRNQDVKESYINLNENVFISNEVYKKLTLHLRENDIVIPRVGTLGNAALITREMLPCTANQNLAVIRLKGFNSYAVIMTLVSNIGKSQIYRTSTGNVQPWLNLEAIGTLRIPMYSPEFQSKIEQIVKSAHSKLAESKSLYAEAEEILLTELGLKDWQPKKVSVSVKYFSDFAKSDRLDAEYYQAKYDEIEETIKLLYSVLGARECVIARELTKINEEYISGKLSELVNLDFKTIKGEMVIIVEGQPKSDNEISDEKIQDKIRFYLSLGVSEKAAIQIAVEELKVPKNRVYKLVQEMK